MPGQGAIIATGAIDYPAEYPARRPRCARCSGISKVMMVTCTYDHRVIQGAESGRSWASLQALLHGEDGFYEEIFEHLRFRTSRCAGRRTAPVTIPGVRLGNCDEIAEEAAVLQLINAYRVRGHLIADLDPLGREPTLPSRTRPGDLRPDHLGSGPRVSHRQPGESIGETHRSRSRRCARFSKRCAGPTAARSDAST